jgi:hypothetical protein
MDRIFNLTLGLDRDEPLTGGLADRDVLHCAQNSSTVPVPQPAKSWQKYTVVCLVQFVALRKPEVVADHPFLEAWKLRALGEEVGVGSIEVFQRLL